MPKAIENPTAKTRVSAGLSWDVQFAISVAGAGLFLWLAFRDNLKEVHPLPTFPERLLQVAPYLAEFVIGLAFVLWGVLLTRRLKIERKTQRSVTADPGQLHPKAWSLARKFAVAAYIVAFFPILGEHFARFLWPMYARRISDICGAIALVILVFDALRNRREKKQREIDAVPTIGAREEPWIANDFVRDLFYLALSVGAAFSAHFIFNRYWPTHERTALPLVVLLIAAVFIYLRQSSRHSATGPQIGTQQLSQPVSPARVSGKDTKKALWGTIYATGILALMLSPLPSHWKTGIFFGQLPLAVIYLTAMARLKMRIYHLGHDGHTDRALEINRRWARIPGYGSSLEGIILFNAGRYREAQEFIKPFAFDSHGNPRLATQELYTYALALGNDGRTAEAQPLLEASIPVAEKPDGFRVALATNLLEQNKDPERSRELLEQAMATPARQSTGYGQRSDEAKRTARYAWALASCGRKKDAETQIDAALAKATGLKDSDLAGVHYFIGEAWKAYGATAKAREALQQAIRLRPEGVTAIGAKKALAKLT